MNETIETTTHVELNPRQKPSPRALKAVSLVAKGSSKAAALRKAGYSNNTAKAPSKVFKSKSLQDLLNKFLPDAKLLQVHKDGLSANKKVFKNNNETGEIEEVSDEPDFMARHKYLETAYKIKGHLKNADGPPSLQVNMVSIRNKYA